MQFNKRLREIIEYRGLIIKEVAYKAGIKESTFRS